MQKLKYGLLSALTAIFGIKVIPHKILSNNVFVLIWIVMALVSVVFGIVSLKKDAVFGKILGVLGIAWSILIFAFVTYYPTN